MRTRPKLLLVIGVIVALTLVLAACSSAPATPPPSEFTSGGNGQNNNGGETAAETEPADTGTGGEAETSEELVDSGNEEANGLAEDMPIPQGAYDLNVSSTGHQVVYKVGGQAQQVVDFYAGRLTEFDWMEAGQDTVVGNMALMVREKENGDRLSINMQYNPNAEFTVVTLVVTRK